MERFLKAKHWQVFLIIIGLPVFIILILFPLIKAGHDPKIVVKFMPFVSLLIIGGLFGWFWSVVIGLQSRLPDGLRMKVGRFKTFFIIPLIYIILFWGAGFLFTIGIYGDEQHLKSIPLLGSIIGYILIIIPLHLFSIFCFFYCLYFVAKTFKTVELQKKLSFSDFAGDFFLFWFFPIGVWIVQPKINVMIEGRDKE